MQNWDECILLEGRTNIYHHFENKETLLIIGLGFDPRSSRFLDLLKEIKQQLTVYIVIYDDVGVDEDRYKNNYDTICSICDNNNIPYQSINIPMYKFDGMKRTLIISESVKTHITKNLIKCFGNIVLDISAMPKGVSFSLIKRLVMIKTISQKLCIAVCENSEYDDSIIPIIGEESAEYLPGFNTFSLTMEQDEPETVLFPALGMEYSDTLRIIANYTKPIEICPVVPFPSMDIQRGEKMLRSCGEVLFRERGVETRDIIYVPESDPRLVCHKLSNTVEYYKKAFSIDNDRAIQYVFASSSSKLIDIGILLAVLELDEKEIKTGIVIVGKQSYRTIKDYNIKNDRLFCLCLDENIYEWG